MNTFSRRHLLGAVGASFLTSTAFARTLPPAKWDEETDMVIVGAGGAGLSAACTAVEHGIKPLLLEKTAFPGGSSLICTSMYAVAGTSMQSSQGVSDSETLFAEDMLNTGEHFNDPALVKAFVHGAKVQYDWMHEKLHLDPRELAVGAGMRVARGHVFRAPVVIKALLDYAKQGGATVRTQTPVLELITDPQTGTVLGVKCQARDHSTHFIRARRGVLLASGGFARSPELLKKFSPYLTNCDVLSATGNTGDGLRMAMALGADFADTAFIKATYGSKPGITKVEEMTTIYYSGAIMVNQAGKRFVDESRTYMTLSDAALKQPNAKTYLLFDRAILDAAMKEPQGRELFEMIPQGTIPPYVMTANSIEALAKLANIDPAALKDTVDRYNHAAETGTDDEMGRRTLADSAGKPVPIKQGPYFLFPSSSVIFGTYCGVRISPVGRVQNVLGEWIPNLWAAGEVTGGIHGANYMSGSGYAKALAFGRLAALDMLKSTTA